MPLNFRIIHHDGSDTYVTAATGADFDFGPTVSIIVPCYNEEAVIEETHRRLTDNLSVE